MHTSPPPRLFRGSEHRAGEARLIYYFGFFECEGYIRQQIAQSFQEDPALLRPEGNITRMMRRRWYQRPRLPALRFGIHRQRTEVDVALARRKDPNATQPIIVEV